MERELTFHREVTERILEEDTVEVLSPERIELFDDEPETQGGLGKTDPNITSFRKIAATRWDDNRHIVKQYIKGLVKKGDERSLQLLAQALKKGAPYTQSLAANGLRKLGIQAIPVLVQNMMRENGTTHPDVYRALRMLGKPLVQVLIKMLRGQHIYEPTKPEQLQIIKVLGEYPSYRVSKALCSYLTHKDKTFRERAFLSLKRQGKKAERPLIDLLRTKEGHERRKDILYLLGHMRAYHAVPIIQQCLVHERNAYLLTLEAWALGETGNPAAMGALVYVLEDANYPWMVRRSFVRALGKLGCPEGTEILVPLIDERELREAVIEALGYIHTKDSKKILRNLMKCDVGYLRFLAVCSLSRHGDKKAIRHMVNGLLDPNMFVQRQTRKAMEQLYNQQEIEEIERYLASAPKVKHTAWSKLIGLDDYAPYEEESEEAFVAEDWECSEEELNPPREPQKVAPTPAYKPKKKGLLERLREKAERKIEEMRRQMEQQGYGYPPYYDPYDFGPGGGNQGGPGGPSFGNPKPW